MELYGFNFLKSDHKVPIEEKRFIIDGYFVDEAKLEGLKFEITFDDNSITDVKVNDENHFENFNTKMYLELVKSMAQDLIDEGEEVELPVDIRKKYNVDGGFFEIKN